MNRNQWYEYSGNAGNNYGYGLACRIINSLEDAIANNRTVLEVTQWLERQSSYAGSWNLNDNTSWYRLDGGNQINVTTRFDGRSSAIGLNQKAYMGYNGAVFPKGNSVVYYIDHNQNGTKSIDLATMLYAGVGSLNQWTASANITLPTIPRQANVLSANNFNSNQNPYLTFNNNGGFVINVRLEFAGVNIQKNNIPNTGNYTFSLTEAERNFLYSKCPNSKTLTVRYVIETMVNGVATWWSWIDRTMTVVESSPEFNVNQLSYKDINTDIVAITGNNQHIVRNNSILEVTFPTAIAKNYASIVEYEILLNGVSTIKTSAGTYSLGKVDSSRDLTLTIKAIDTRGITTTMEKLLTIYDWVNPTATITANRINNFENDTVVKPNVTISSVNGKNAIMSIVCYYKKVTDAEFEEVNLTNNTASIIDLDNNSPWNIRIKIVDKFGETIYNLTIAKGIPLAFFDIRKLSMAVNKFPEHSSSFEVGGTIYQNDKEILDYDVIDTW